MENVETCIEMDQRLAKRLLVEGATLVILNVPEGTDFGVDLKSWTVGENFKGLKMIPPGFHFVHYSAANEYGDLAPRIGFLHNFQPGEFIVKQWDVDEENVSEKPIDRKRIQSLKDNLRDLDRFLGPYPYDVWGKWKELTSHVDEAVVERCTPLCGFVRSTLELEHCTDASRPRGSCSSTRKRKRGSRFSVEEKEELLLPDLKPKPGTELRLTPLPDKQYPDDATPSEITKHSLDSSYALDSMLNKLPHAIEILGELELSFVCFLCGQSLDSFEHWKKLVTLICRADSIIPNKRLIYIEFLKVLESQLEYVPEEVLCDIVASNNFVYHNLRTLFVNIEQNEEIDGRLKSQASRIRSKLSSKFLWDFQNLQEEEEDDAPVVVSLH